jgi:hypothetical protein
LKEERVDITLTNLSPYLAIVTLNSGITLHLAPSQVSEPIDDLEVNGNLKVEKLVNVGQLAVHQVERNKPEPGHGEPTH